MSEVASEKQNWPELTARERQVVGLLVRNHSRPVIAKLLGISEKTFDSHRLNILRKTACRGNLGLVRYAMEKGYDL